MADNENDKNGDDVAKPSATDSNAAVDDESNAKPGTDYAQLMDMMATMQANQDRMAAQIERISDAQSMLVGKGVVIHEAPTDDIDNSTDDDLFVPLEQLDFNI